jgi:hypothetical protein
MTSRLTSAVAVGLALWAFSDVAGAYCRTTTAASQPDPLVCPTLGVPLMWTGGCTGIRLDTRVVPPGVTTEQFRASARESIAAWKNVACDVDTRAPPTFELVLLGESTAPVGYDNLGANQNVLAFLARWPNDESHPPNAAAITIVTFGARTGAIFDADTEFNVQARFPFSAEGAPGTTDLRTVVAHELGHVQGLAHSADRSAVMWSAAGQGERRRTPNADDVAGLCAIYPPSRAVVCDPEARSENVEGGGLTCRAVPGARGVALLVLLGAAAMARAARRRTR